MRAIAGQRETVVEFSSGEDSDYQDTYRLILPHDSWRFLLERLARDEHRPWIWRWEPCGRGFHNEVRILRCEARRDSMVGPLPARLALDIAAAIRYARTGNVASGRGRVEAVHA